MGVNCNERVERIRSKLHDVPRRGARVVIQGLWFPYLCEKMSLTEGQFATNLICKSKFQFKIYKTDLENIDLQE